jgi:hypothetical protein
MPSNDEEVKDVPLFETFVNTPEEGTNTSPLYTKGCFLQIAQGL